MKKKVLVWCGLLLTSCSLLAQVGIGTENPHPSAILDLTSTKQGLLAPRITLKSSSDVVTIANPEKGLLVYNTGNDPNFLIKGYLYWSGTEWRKMDGTEIKKGMIDDLQCGSAVLIPQLYTAGTYYKGTMTIPYVGGNGGQYEGGTAITALENNGLKATLLPGTLNYGNGQLQYNVEGMPTASAPDVLSTFQVSFPKNDGTTESCEAVVGQSSEIKTIKYVINTTSPIGPTTPDKSITKIGNLIVRYNGNTDASAGYIEFAALTATHISWIYSKAGTGGINLQGYGQAAVLAPDASLGPDWKRLNNIASVPGNASVATSDLNGPNRDLGSVLITLHNTFEVYRVTVLANRYIQPETRVDRVGVVTDAPSAVTIFVEALQ